MWTPFPLTTQLVGLNLLKKCEGAYVIMTIRISPMPGLASLVAEAKKRRRGEETLTASSSSCTPNPSLPLFVPLSDEAWCEGGAHDETAPRCHSDWLVFLAHRLTTP